MNDLSRDELFIRYLYWSIDKEGSRPAAAVNTGLAAFGPEHYKGCKECVYDLLCVEMELCTYIIGRGIPCFTAGKGHEKRAEDIDRVAFLATNELVICAKELSDASFTKRHLNEIMRRITFQNYVFSGFSPLKSKVDYIKQAGMLIKAYMEISDGNPLLFIEDLRLVYTRLFAGCYFDFQFRWPLQLISIHEITWIFKRIPQTTFSVMGTTGYIYNQYHGDINSAVADIQKWHSTLSLERERGKRALLLYTSSGIFFEELIQNIVVEHVLTDGNIPDWKSPRICEYVLNYCLRHSHDNYDEAISLGEKFYEGWVEFRPLCKHIMEKWKSY